MRNLNLCSSLKTRFLNKNDGEAFKRRAIYGAFEDQESDLQKSLRGNLLIYKNIIKSWNTFFFAHDDEEKLI